MNMMKVNPAKGPFRIYDLGGGGGFDPDGRLKSNTPKKRGRILQLPLKKSTRF